MKTLKAWIAGLGTSAALGIHLSILWDMPTEMYNRAVLALFVTAIAIGFGIAATK